MRILHTALFLHPPAGVVNQMAWEAKAAHELGLQWEVRIFGEGPKLPEVGAISSAGTPPSKPIPRFRAWWRSRVAYTRWLRSREAEVDVYLLRYLPYDPFQALFIRASRKPVYLVHHTLTGPELRAAAGFGGKIKALADDLIARYSVSRAHGIVAVTREIIKYEENRSRACKPSIVYPNGIVFDSESVNDDRDATPAILFVSSYFAPWHGLEAVLRAAARSSSSFTLHLVGLLSEQDVALAKKDSRVIIHGPKTHSEIRQISAKCWVALSAFSLDQQGMQEACTLKVRESLMMGLPIYSGHQDVFPHSFPFYRKGPPDFQKILEYATEVRNSDRGLVACAAKPYIDKVALVKELYKQIVQENGHASSFV